jgi:hypothetical protein
MGIAQRRRNKKEKNPPKKYFKKRDRDVGKTEPKRDRSEETEKVRECEKHLSM